MSEVTRSVSCWVWLAWVVAETTRKSHLCSSCALRCSEAVDSFSAMITTRSLANMF